MKKGLVEYKEVTAEFLVITEAKPNSLTNSFILKGPMSPVLAGKQIADEFDIDMYGLISISFRDIHGDYMQGMYNEYEKGEGLTGYGLFLLVTKEAYILFIDAADTLEMLAVHFPLESEESEIKQENISRWYNYLPEEGVKQLMSDALSKCKDVIEAVERVMFANQQN